MSRIAERTTIGTVIAITTMSLIPPAFADTIRHCRSFYEVQALAINPPNCSDQEFINNRCENNVPHGSKIPFGRFESRGSCGNLVPNRCRERARNHAQDCMRAHWDTRHDRERPELCNHDKGVEGYGIVDIKKSLELTACCGPGVPDSATQHWRKVMVSLRGITTGDKKCPGVLEFSSTYKIDCTRIDCIDASGSFQIPATD